MRCLITGAAGFIGSHLTDLLLSQGAEVTGLDNLTSGKIENLAEALNNPKFKFEKIDLTNVVELENLQDNFDHIFHLAALAEIVPSIQNPDVYFSSNVIGTYNLCQKARKMPLKKLVYAASSSCYGIPDHFPTNETSEIRPQYPYALTKFLGEQIVMHWNQIYKVPSISLRLFNVYGPRARTSGNYGAVMGVFLAQMLSRKPLTVVGDGEQTRDFTYIEDVASAFYMAATSKVDGAIYNVGSGQPRKIIDLARMISKEPFVNVPKRPGEPDQTFADISKIESELSWRPVFSLEDGISRVLKETSHWANAPVWTPQTIADATSDWFKYLGKEDA